MNSWIPEVDWRLPVCSTPQFSSEIVLQRFPDKTATRGKTFYSKYMLQNEVINRTLKCFCSAAWPLADTSSCTVQHEQMSWWHHGWLSGLDFLHNGHCNRWRQFKARPVETALHRQLSDIRLWQIRSFSTTIVWQSLWKEKKSYFLISFSNIRISTAWRGSIMSFLHVSKANCNDNKGAFKQRELKLGRKRQTTAAESHQSLNRFDI